MNDNGRLGAEGEQLAAKYLEQLGLHLLARNWRGKSGEIDLVMHSDAEMVFVEVKTRRSLRFGDPLEAVDTCKLDRLHRLANEWMEEQSRSFPYRIDLVGILWSEGNEAQIEHIERLSE